MSLTDPIADTLSRIRNAQMRNYYYADCLHSKYLKAIIAVLKEEGYVEDFEEITGPKGFLMIRVHLRYQSGRGVIRRMWRVSKPGCRVYRSVDKMDKVANGLGVYVLSTSRGVMSCRQAREIGVGGEMLLGIV